MLPPEDREALLNQNLTEDNGENEISKKVVCIRRRFKKSFYCYIKHVASPLVDFSHQYQLYSPL